MTYDSLKVWHDEIHPSITNDYYHLEDPILFEDGDSLSYTFHAIYTSKPNGYDFEGPIFRVSYFMEYTPYPYEDIPYEPVAYHDVWLLYLAVVIMILIRDIKRCF